MLEDFVVNILQNVDAKQIRRMLSKMELKKGESRYANVKLFKKILKFCKLQNSFYSLLFGVSTSDYQNKILRVVYRIGKWVLKKYEADPFPVLTFDKHLSEILADFNHIQQQNGSAEKEILCYSKPRDSHHHNHHHSNESQHKHTHKETDIKNLLDEYDD
jgi:hypothetical protein